MEMSRPIIQAARVVSPLPSKEDMDWDETLRPKSFEEFVGQKRTVELLRRTKRAPGSTLRVLLSGAPGLGKTTLAQLLVRPGRRFETLSDGSGLKTITPRLLYYAFRSGKDLIIDEIHLLNKRTMTALYTAVEEGRFYEPGVSYPYPQRLQPIHIIATTTATDLSKVPAGLVGQFRFVATLEYYPEDQIQEIVKRSARRLGVAISDEVAVEVARRSRNTPRLANRFLLRLRDLNATSRLEGAKEAFHLLGVNKFGCDEIDREYLRSLVEEFRGSPVSLQALARSIGYEAKSIAAFVEPYLIRKGFVEVVSARRRLRIPKALMI